MKKPSLKFLIILLAAIIAGLLIGRMDSLPNWDDSGITAGLILISNFIFGLLMPEFAWLWAIITGVCIFGFDVILRNNFGSALAILIAFIGSYTGVLFKKFILSRIKNK